MTPSGLVLPAEIQGGEKEEGQVRRRSGQIRKDRVVARDQKVRHFIKLSTSQPAYVLLKPYCACRSITRSLLFLKADTSCSDNLFHFMSDLLQDDKATLGRRRGNCRFHGHCFAPMGGPIQGTEARFRLSLKPTPESRSTRCASAMASPCVA